MPDPSGHQASRAGEPSHDYPPLPTRIDALTALTMTHSQNAGAGHRRDAAGTERAPAEPHLTALTKCVQPRVLPDESGGGVAVTAAGLSPRVGGRELWRGARRARRGAWMVARRLAAAANGLDGSAMGRWRRGSRDVKRCDPSTTMRVPLERQACPYGSAGRALTTAKGTPILDTGTRGAGAAQRGAVPGMGEARAAVRARVLSSCRPYGLDQSSRTIQSDTGSMRPVVELPVDSPDRDRVAIEAHRHPDQAVGVPVLDAVDSRLEVVASQLLAGVQRALDRLGDDHHPCSA